MCTVSKPIVTVRRGVRHRVQAFLKQYEQKSIIFTFLSFGIVHLRQCDLSLFASLSLRFTGSMFQRRFPPVL